MDTPTASRTLVQPQRAHQRRALALVLFSVALVLMGVFWGQPWFEAWLTDTDADADERARRTAWIVVGVVSAVCLITLITSGWLATMAWRIRKANCYPPPGYPVLHATPLQQGASARRQAIWHGVAALTSVLLCAGVLGYLFHRFPLIETLYVLRP